MTRIKLCGLSRPEDIVAANALQPEYVGFVFAPQSPRFVSPETAERLRRMLSPAIQTVGVFVQQDPQTVAALLNRGILDLAQLHGDEDAHYLVRLRRATKRPIIQAFRVQGAQDIADAMRSKADYVLLDAGAGTGTSFDWNLLRQMERPYFLAGGLDARNAGEAVARWHPFAVDVSSGIETNGYKDPIKMAAFVSAVRKEETI